MNLLIMTVWTVIIYHVGYAQFQPIEALKSVWTRLLTTGSMAISALTAFPVAVHFIASFFPFYEEYHQVFCNCQFVVTLCFTIAPFFAHLTKVIQSNGKPFGNSFWIIICSLVMLVCSTTGFFIVILLTWLSTKGGETQLNGESKHQNSLSQNVLLQMFYPSVILGFHASVYFLPSEKENEEDENEEDEDENDEDENEEDDDENEDAVNGRKPCTRSSKASRLRSRGKKQGSTQHHN